VLVAGLAIVAAATVVTEALHRDTEQRLLDQRTAEAGALLGTSVGSLQTPLASAAVLAEETNGDPRSFRAVMASLTGTGKRFVSAALYSTTSTEPLDVLGDPSVLSTTGAPKVQGMLDAAAAAPALSIVDLLDLPGTHLGYAITAPEKPGRYVVYAETALPQRRPRTTGPFEDVDYAAYLGTSPTADELIFSSVDGPITGRTGRAVVPFGDKNLLLVTSTSITLGGTLSKLLPWLIAILGTILVVAGAVLAQRLLRRRSEAEALANDVSRLYEDQRHRTETLQRSLLPRDLPQPPGVHVAARYWPADVISEIGGDFYDLFALDEDRWGITIGDVCGKGIEAAALTGVTRHTIRAAARHLDSPAEVLRWTYEAITAYSDETYATVCFAFLTLRDGRAELDIALGGHPGPLRCRPDGSVDALGLQGTVLGLVEPRVRSIRYPLNPGDTVVFYTDGVTDARGDEAVSLDELEEAVRGSAPLGPAETANAIRSSVERRRPGGSKDDTAILVLHVDDGSVPDASRGTGERVTSSL